MSESRLGEWRTGREDMQSYDGLTGEPFASIYADDPDGEMHMGERLAATIARTFGPDCKPNARLMAAAPQIVVALKALRIDANRLADRNLGGTYEADVRRSLVLADAAIAKAEGR